MYKLGIEMEIIARNGIAKSQVLAAIREAGINITDEGYTHRVMDSWKCVSDSSLSHGGFELVSPPMKGASNIDNQITTICEAIKGLTRVNSTCGIHVHFEVLDKYHFKRRVDTRTERGKLQALKNKPAKKFTANLLRNYGYFQTVIDSLVAPSRRGNTYCRNIPEGAQMNKTQISNFVSNKENYAHLIYGMSGRYQVINLSSLENYGTVEFRQMNGSTNQRKILNWIRILERLVSRSWDRKYSNRDCKDFNLTMDGFMDFLGFGNNEIRKYSRNRARNNGFSAISTVENQTRNNGSPNSESDEETALSTNALSALDAEIREACFILDNDRDYYDQIKMAVYRYENSIITRLELHEIIKTILRMHDEIPWFPTEDNFTMGLFVRGVIIYYLESLR